MIKTILLCSLLLVAQAVWVFGPLGEKALRGQTLEVTCAADIDVMMQLDPDAFDQDMWGGWRSLAARKGCEKAAAELIKTYITRNWNRLSSEKLSMMHWHAGQLEAFAGDYNQAVPLLMAGTSPEKRRVEMGFHEYALGTIAFLNGDLRGLKAARERLAATPKPTWYAAERKAGRLLSWPLNLDVLDSLIQCFGSPYAVAYNNACPGAKPAS